MMTDNIDDKVKKLTKRKNRFETIGCGTGLGTVGALAFFLMQKRYGFDVMLYTTILGTAATYVCAQIAENAENRIEAMKNNIKKKQK